MRKIASIIFIAALLTSMETLAQKQPNRLQLPVVEILDNNLKIICDSILDHEKKCPYFNDDLLFNMRFIIDEEMIYLNIESWKVILYCDAYDYSNVYCFKNKNTTYLVKANSSKLFDFFFKKTGEIKEVPFERIPFIFDSGGMSYWYYEFANNNFICTEHNYGYCDQEKNKTK